MHDKNKTPNNSDLRNGIYTLRIKFVLKISHPALRRVQAQPLSVL